MLVPSDTLTTLVANEGQLVVDIDLRLMSMSATFFLPDDQRKTLRFPLLTGIVAFPSLSALPCGRISSQRRR